MPAHLTLKPSPCCSTFSDMFSSIFPLQGVVRRIYKSLGIAKAVCNRHSASWDRNNARHWNALSSFDIVLFSALSTVAVLRFPVWGHWESQSLCRAGCHHKLSNRGSQHKAVVWRTPRKILKNIDTIWCILASGCKVKQKNDCFGVKFTFLILTNIIRIKFISSFIHTL